MKIRALTLIVCVLATAGAALAAGTPAPATASAVSPAVAGPPSPSAPAAQGAVAAPGPAGEQPVAPAGVDPEDFAARVALERAEQASLQQARPVVPAAEPAAPRETQRADLGGMLGLAVSAALISFSLVMGWSQRRYLRALLRPGSAARLPQPAAAAAGAVGTSPARAGKSEAPAARQALVSEVTELQQLAGELQRTIGELRAERSRWEQEWEQREMQYRRTLRREEAGAQAAAAPAPASPAGLRVAREASARVPVDGASAEPAAPMPADPAAVLARVEQLLGEGLSAEEISKRLRVGLREIQWMMRLGAQEAGSRG